MTFPREWEARMRSLLPEDADAFFRALHENCQRAFFVFPRRLSEDVLLSLFTEYALEKIPYAPNAYYFQGEHFGDGVLHRAGAIYIQEPAAGLPVTAFELSPGDRVLDLCSAPGGKALAASKKIGPEGVLVCNEPSPERRRVLLQNLERCGAPAAVTGFDARRLPKIWEGWFDAVICDAPCSGEGMARKSPELFETWSEENVRRLAALQKEILESAAKALRPGGMILYSTCTYSIEENEEQINAFLERHENFEQVFLPAEIKALASPGVDIKASRFSPENCRRCYPHRFRGEGQFFTILKNTDAPEENREKKRQKSASPQRPDPREATLTRFLEETLAERAPFSIFFRDECCFFTALDPERAAETVSPGILIGEIRKGRIVPHHRFFTSDSLVFRHEIALFLSDRRVAAYLAGEEIELEEENGFARLRVGKTPLGGVKITNHRAKNYYPKGLRKAL